MSGRTTLEGVVVPTYMDDCRIIDKTKDSIEHIKAKVQKPSSGVIWDLAGCSASIFRALVLVQVVG